MNTPNTASVSGSPKLSEILDLIEERANKATSPPWNAGDLGFTIGHISFVPRPVGLIPAKIAPEDLAFIASSRTDVPKLVKALRRVIAICKSQLLQTSETAEIACQRAFNVEKQVAAILENRAAVGEKTPDLEEKEA